MALFNTATNRIEKSFFLPTRMKGKKEKAKHFTPRKKGRSEPTEVVP
jgi:hypothetical protein